MSRRMDANGWLPLVGMSLASLALFALGRWLQLVDDNLADLGGED